MADREPWLSKQCDWSACWSCTDERCECECHEDQGDFDLANI